MRAICTEIYLFTDWMMSAIFWKTCLFTDWTVGMTCTQICLSDQDDLHRNLPIYYKTSLALSRYILKNRAKKVADLHNIRIQSPCMGHYLCSVKPFSWAQGLTDYVYTGPWLSLKRAPRRVKSFHGHATLSLAATPASTSPGLADG